MSLATTGSSPRGTTAFSDCFTSLSRMPNRRSLASRASMPICATRARPGRVSRAMDRGLGDVQGFGVGVVGVDTECLALLGLRLGSVAHGKVLPGEARVERGGFGGRRAAQKRRLQLERGFHVVARSRERGGIERMDGVVLDV